MLSSGLERKSWKGLKERHEIFKLESIEQFSNISEHQCWFYHTRPTVKNVFIVYVLPSEEITHLKLRQKLKVNEQFTKHAFYYNFRPLNV